MFHRNCGYHSEGVGAAVRSMREYSAYCKSVIKSQAGDTCEHPEMTKFYSFKLLTILDVLIACHEG